jgi:hypothetical protein
MRKLNLRLEDLAVESFQTVGVDGRRGTVRGQEATFWWSMCGHSCDGTCNETCEGQFTCKMDTTCAGDFTCDYNQTCRGQLTCGGEEVTVE